LADAGVFDGEAEPVDAVEVDVVVLVNVVESDADLVSDCAEDELVDEESAEDDESVSSAHAGPGMLVVNPTPMPRATASAPTRPMNLEYPCEPSLAARCCGEINTPCPPALTAVLVWGADRAALRSRARLLRCSRC
jgi:hypothetical protein